MKEEKIEETKMRAKGKRRDMRGERRDKREDRRDKRA
jgi:hypothetical protein